MVSFLFIYLKSVKLEDILWFKSNEFFYCLLPEVDKVKEKQNKIIKTILWSRKKNVRHGREIFFFLEIFKDFSRFLKVGFLKKIFGVEMNFLILGFEIWDLGLEGLFFIKNHFFKKRKEQLFIFLRINAFYLKVERLVKRKEMLLPVRLAC